MAGKIIADTLETGAGADIATSYVVNGSAKAWMQINGTGTVAIQGSFNTSSVTDNTTGDYEENFTSTLSNDDYSGLGTSRRGTAYKNYGNTTLLPTSSSSSQVCVGSEDSYSGEIPFDPEWVHTAIFGDLA